MFKHRVLSSALAISVGVSDAFLFGNASDPSPNNGNAADPDHYDQTSVTNSLNAQIAKSAHGVYKGGKGVLVRTPDFFSGGGNVVVPATLWVNDIRAPNQLYPAGHSTGGGGNPWCPHGNTDGYYDLSWSKCDFPTTGPWKYAVVAAVIGDDGLKKLMGAQSYNTIQDAGWDQGVFYPYDANSGDKRCRNLASSSGFDCPGYWVPYQGNPYPDPKQKGAGSFPMGNPYKQGGGGGAGCHFDTNSHAIDQTDAYQGTQNLVQNADCQCNSFFQNDWSKWVDNWISNTKEKPGFSQRSWLAGNPNKRAPAWGLDTAICWMTNPRDMINLQNALWDSHTRWLNGMAPQFSNDNPMPYWGWNEVPVTKDIIDKPEWWDAVMIKLPPWIDSVSKLGGTEQKELEADLKTWENQHKIVPGGNNAGKRPGSYIVFVREYQSGKDFQRQFFCENWSSPSGWYKIHSMPATNAQGGACYIDKSQSSVVV